MTAAEFADPLPEVKGEPLQIVRLNMEEKKAEINEDAIGRLTKSLKAIGAHKVAVVSVMGAFRTGKSFLLDLFLRFLRYEDHVGSPQGAANALPRADGIVFPTPAWITFAGSSLEGTDRSSDGFRFKGGMDAITEGIWIWSEPFVRNIKGKNIALLLMDTQGAWDGQMTKEQSATIFGLTAVLSSKQIYNINMQIQEDKVENLAFFMQFAQAALHRASTEMECSEVNVDRPFQSLDFLVRDWKYFKPNFSMQDCRNQMREHMDRFVNPAKVVENSTADALQSMFQRIECFCMPHPGFAIERDTWSGDVSDIDQDFIRFADAYVREVFTEGLDTKVILGSELTTVTFPLVLRDFVNAFQDAAPTTMSFTQAMTSATVLLAKEQAMKSYTKKMDDDLNRNLRGMDENTFESLHKTVTKQIRDEFEKITIFGPESTRTETWKSIEESLVVLHQKYMEDNARRLEKALVAFASVALIGLGLFVLDRLSDFACDWWSQTCADMSKLMLTTYLSIFAYIGFQVYNLGHDGGRLQMAVATGELWKEMMRLIAVYGDLAMKMKFSDLPQFARSVISDGLGSAASNLQQRKVDAHAKKAD